MRLHRRYVAALVAAAALTAAAGCGSGSDGDDTGGSSTTAGSREKVTVGFVTAGVNLPFYSAMKCGAERAATAEDVDLLWQGTDSIAASDEMRTLQAIQSRNPDGIILVPWDSNAFVAPTRTMIAQGTPVLTVDGSLSQPIAPYLGTDNLAAGAQAGEALGELIDGRGTVAILTAAPGNEVQNKRWRGFKAAIERRWPDVKVLEPQYVGSDTAKAATATTSLLSGNPDLAAVYTTQDASGEGAASALRAAGKQGDVKLVSYDATPRQVQGLKAGTYDALVAQNPREIGEQMVRDAGRMIREDAQLPKQQYVPSKFLTRENVDDASTEGFVYSGC
jgi:ribose transport system substrate-binding protein